jgi:hypothetical protein
LDIRCGFFSALGVSTVISVDGDVTPPAAPVKLATRCRWAALKLVRAALRFWLADGSRISIMPNTLTAIVTSTNYPMRDSSKAGTSNWFSGLMRWIRCAGSGGVKKRQTTKCKSRPRPPLRVFAARSSA